MSLPLNPQGTREMDAETLAEAYAQILRESEERAAEVERLNAELREVDRLKTEFLSMISHELRTPLTAIIGYTDLLLRGTHGALNERQGRHQQAVKHGAQRLLAIINDLLDVSRLDSALIELDLGEVRLGSVFQLALEAVRESAGEARLMLGVEEPADLPTVWGDQARLVQVLVNLLSNAVKFTPEGGRIDLWAERVEGRVRVNVRDTGAGIAAENLAHIWDRFFQADQSVRRRYGGTGLGLAIVRGLVELHGGTVAARSEGNGRGATFSFDLPVYRTAPTRVAPPAEPWPGSETATVLVVEDQRDNRELLATMLEEMLGVRVITATDGIDALERAEQQPDLILLDLMLPRLDGFEVVRRLKAAAHTREIPVLALTALTRPTERDEALAAGCDGLILKPFDTDELIAAVATRLRMKDEG
jgi:signal transduction histidine kinase/ActR/RegA family two-component response regulator